jgi:ABC-type branched-subunit amino acid transport system substrate-binding protein
MKKNIKTVWLSVLALVVVVGIYVSVQKDSTSIKVGVVTPLTGAVAYWGESSTMGFELAKADLVKEGINVEFIIEDGQLDPKVALSAAQKLVNIDKVDAMYSEFNPAAIAVNSFLKDRNILSVYDAAPISPLKESINVYKTYLDYEDSCRKVADLLKSRGIKSIGVLKLNMEFGDLCLKGISRVYTDGVYVEDYNAGSTDFRVALSKLKAKNVQVLFNASFQPETLASLKQARELGMASVFVGLSETISPDVVAEYSSLLEGSIMYGLPNVLPDFVARISKEFPGRTVANYQALALAYIHSMQIARALNKCSSDLACARNEMDNAKPETLMGFTGFTNRIAGFEVLIQEWKGGGFVDVEK